METIFSPDGHLDTCRLDKLVETFYRGSSAEKQRAHSIITEFQDSPDAWKLVDKILEESNNLETKYMALQILEKLVRKRWNTLNPKQADGIKDYVISLIMKKVTSGDALEKESIFIKKLNLIFVHILKYVWPDKWPSFISEIVSSSRTSSALCENNIYILKLLSEEIFDYSSNQMTTDKAKKLKVQLNEDFPMICALYSEVLVSAQKPKLISATLNAVLRFLRWIPLGYVFETQLIDLLTQKFLLIKEHRNITLSCLTEISAIKSEERYSDRFIHIFDTVMRDTSEMVYYFDQEDIEDDGHDFVQNFALFLTTTLGNHLQALEKNSNMQDVLLAHSHLLKITSIKDKEIFKICLEYWNKFIGGFLPETSFPFVRKDPFSLSTARHNAYSQILSGLRSVMIDNMVKPEEVLIVEDENGEIVREFTKDTDTLSLYDGIKECLLNLSRLDSEETEGIMKDRLSLQFEEEKLNREGLNKLCWAIGSISGSMSEEIEKRFIVVVIKDLLSLCEDKSQKDDKAIIASNIMYIVGQYPRFLKKHWKFLKTVIKKLFEFMHESHEGIKDMACDTFIKIVLSCKKYFATLQAGEKQIFVSEILVDLNTTICDLQSEQICVFYEAVGHIVKEVPDNTDKNHYLELLMANPNQKWVSLIDLIKTNPINSLSSLDIMKTLDHILRANIAACKSVGATFIHQLSLIFLDMLVIYRDISSRLSEMIVSKGVGGIKSSVGKKMVLVRKHIIKLVNVYVLNSENPSLFSTNFIESFFQAVLCDYNGSREEIREPEVLAVSGTIISILPSYSQGFVSDVLDAVLEPTLTMLVRDFVSYPDHRISFFVLIQSINSHCFGSLLGVQFDKFKIVVDSIIWAFKHSIREVSDLGLSICFEMLLNVSKAEISVRNVFYSNFLIGIFESVFHVLADNEHMSGFEVQAEILAHIFYIVDKLKIDVSLFDPNEPAEKNTYLLKEHLSGLLLSAFPYLDRQGINVFIDKLFGSYANTEIFRSNLRDLLIKIREIPDDSFETFKEEL